MGLFAALTGCVTYRGEVLDPGMTREFTTIYVLGPEPDHHNVTAEVMLEFSRLGLEVRSNPNEPDDIPAGALICRLEVTQGWELTRFARAIRMRVVEPRTHRVVALGHYRSVRLHDTRRAVQQIFARIRLDLGLPAPNFIPSKPAYEDEQRPAPAVRPEPAAKPEPESTASPET